MRMVVRAGISLALCFVAALPTPAAAPPAPTSAPIQLRLDVIVAEMRHAAAHSAWATDRALTAAQLKRHLTRLKQFEERGTAKLFEEGSIGVQFEEGSIGVLGSIGVQFEEVNTRLELLPTVRQGGKILLEVEADHRISGEEHGWQKRARIALRSGETHLLASPVRNGRRLVILVTPYLVRPETRPQAATTFLDPSERFLEVERALRRLQTEVEAMRSALRQR